MQKKINISFIGSGNVATHLAKALYKKGFKIQQIFSRTKKNAEQLAFAVDAEPITSLNLLNDTELIIISVPDDVLKIIYEQLPNFKGILAHTSGISDLDFLQEMEYVRVAYFYPLQTFRKNTLVNLTETPFFINARIKTDQKILFDIASTLSNKVKIINAIQKQQLHLSAVVVNNFVNHLFGLAKENLQLNGLDLTDLRPIIETTINRAMNENPFEIQTGPAKRNDILTMERHLELLKDNPEFQNVYKCLSESIQKKNKI